MSSSDNKAALRRDTRANRAVLARACRNYATQIARFANDLALAPDAIVAGYWPVRDEADPRGLMDALAARGHVLALPRIDERHAALSFRCWKEGDVLVDNHHAIPEPSAEVVAVTPHVVLVPLLAFDTAGHRLGYGGGYYDRTLAMLNVRAIGIAYAGQHVELLPREAHDHPLEAVLTENGLTKFRG